MIMAEAINYKHEHWVLHSPLIVLKELELVGDLHSVKSESVDSLCRDGVGVLKAKAV